jgi:hypothetical protein
MPLPRPASPRVLLADLRAFAAERSRHQWIGLVAAVAMPLTIIYVFYLDGQTNIAPGEQIIYADSWTGNRTDAEIVAAQRERQAQREAGKAERQRQFKELEKRLGIE